MRCKPYVKVSPSPFELHRPLPSRTNTPALQNPVQVLLCERDSPLLLLIFFNPNGHLKSSSQWVLCGPEGDQRDPRELTQHWTSLTRHFCQHLSWRWLEPLLYATSWEFLLAHKFRSLHFFESTIIRTAHPNYNVLTVLINKDNTTLTQQPFPTSKMSPNSIKYKISRYTTTFLKTELNLTSPLHTIANPMLL